MKLSLVVLSAGKLEGKAIEIKVPQFLIGRDPQCHLRPASAMISKKHCALIQKDGKLYIKEFGSTNGSFVNDVQVVNHAEVRNGDTLKIGPLLFQVNLEVAVEAKQPAAAAAKPAPVAAGAAKNEGPAKPPVAASSGESTVDDDIAAMLLSSPESETVHDAAAMGGDVPGGTTVFELPVPSQAAPQENKDGKPPEKDKPKPASAGNTSSAAAAILEKMRKRPRTPPA